MKNTFEPVPAFTVISDELFAVKTAGYKLDFENDHTHRNFSAAAFWDDTISAENHAHDEIDSFYDLTGAYLCSCNDLMYAVEYIYSDSEHAMVPCIWQRVKPV